VFLNSPSCYTGNLEAFLQIQSRLVESHGSDKELEALPIRFSLIGFDQPPLDKQPVLLRVNPKLPTGTIMCA